MAKPGYTEDVLAAPENEIVCWCSHVGKGTILAAKRQGATTLEAIRSTTGACTKCRCTELNPRGRCCSREILALLAG